MDNISGWIKKVTGTPTEKGESNLSKDNIKISTTAQTNSQNKEGVKRSTSTLNTQNRERHSTLRPSREESQPPRGRIHTPRREGENSMNTIRPKGQKRRLHVMKSDGVILAPSDRRNGNDRNEGFKPRGGGRRERPISRVHRAGNDRPSKSYEVEMGEVGNSFGNKAMRIIPLGGLNEVGKNCMCVEYKDDIIVIDIGLQFPEENMPGIDYVIPDISYVKANKKKLRGIVITHGHLDHIGGLHHVMEELEYPKIYATKLTKGLIESRFQEYTGLLDKIDIVEINPDTPTTDAIQLGEINIKWFRVNHSIPDSCGLRIKTPAGTMIHTGDFKFDFTPTDGLHCQFDKLIDFRREGVDVIFADSTNALKPGFCPSEGTIAKNLGDIIQKTPGRIILATFASSIGRLQAIIEQAVKSGRKIFVSGRSMNNNIDIAHRLGFINVPKSHFRKLGPAINDYPPHEVMVITTGSQGEPFAALSRIARDEHPHIQVDFEDTIVFSSSPIPGNERSLYAVIDELYRKGAKIITNIEMDIHASGHAFQGDIKLMHSLVKPNNIVPIHGEYFMRVAHRKLVIEELGYQERNAIMIENGSVLEVCDGKVHKTKEKITTDLMFVDGIGEGTLGSQIIEDRTKLSQGGVIVVSLQIDKDTKALKSEPVISSKGFFDSESIHTELVKEARSAYEGCKKTEEINKEEISKAIERHLQTSLLKTCDKEPSVMTVMDIK